MTNPLRLAIGAALLMSAPLASAAPPVMGYGDFLRLPQPPAPRTLSYGPDPLQHVELWLPAEKGPFPVVLLIHGGCWQTAVAKADIMHRFAERLAAKGVAVWNVEYRGVDVPGGGYPGTFADVAAAADLLRAKGPALGLDPAHVVAAGHSAGGHLALWLAARPRLPRTSVLWSAEPLRIAGVVSQGGIPDLKAARVEAAGACGTDTVDRLVGRARRDPFADTSPVALAPLGVPQVLLAGGVDPIAPPAFATSYARKLKAKGEAVAVQVIPAQSHFELITPGTPAGDAGVTAMLRMLKR